MSLRVLNRETAGAASSTEVPRSATALTALPAREACRFGGAGETDAPLETRSLAGHENSDMATRPTELTA